jgi:nitroreductase
VYQVYTVLAVELEEAIRTRRTHKVYGPEPVDRATLDELFELARWAPNHHLTSPWRFRVLGPEARERLKACAGPEAGKLDRAPTLVVASVVQTGDPQQDEEDRTRRTCCRRGARSTSSCSERMPAGSRTTGARPPSCARRPGVRPSAWETTSTSSA